MSAQVLIPKRTHYRKHVDSTLPSLPVREIECCIPLNNYKYDGDGQFFKGECDRFFIIMTQKLDYLLKVLI